MTTKSQDTFAEMMREIDNAPDDEQLPRLILKALVYAHAEDLITDSGNNNEWGQLNRWGLTIASLRCLPFEDKHECYQGNNDKR